MSFYKLLAVDHFKMEEAIFALVRLDGLIQAPFTQQQVYDKTQTFYCFGLPEPSF